MSTFIIYESMFGNTRDIALAVAEILEGTTSVAVHEVGIAPDVVPADTDLLLIGAPTHQFGISRPSSRDQARKQASGPLVSPGRGIREWLDRFSTEGKRPLVATFDTTLEKPRFLKYMGRASTNIAGRLRRRGFQLIAPPESFWVAGGNGPLVEGEIERARSWAGDLESRVTRGAEPAVIRPWYRRITRV